MVKRKADISMDEWLSKSVGIPEESSSIATVVPDLRAVTTNGPTEGVDADPATTGPVPVPVANMATDEEGASDWFWSLLEQCGYELW